MPEVIFLGAVSIYFILLILFSIGLKKKYPRVGYEELPTATIIVAARNEENNIGRCIK